MRTGGWCRPDDWSERAITMANAPGRTLAAAVTALCLAGCSPTLVEVRGRRTDRLHPLNHLEPLLAASSGSAHRAARRAA